LIEPEIAITVVQRPESVQPVDELLHLQVSLVPTLDDALARSPDLCIVANPSTFHADAATRLLQLNSPVLIEKPLAADLQAAALIQSAELQTGNAALVGYHLRFSDLLPELQRLIASGVIGTPTGFHLSVGQHLDGWRTGTQSELSVSARQELGGGVLLELSHEFDALRFALSCNISEVTACELRFDGAPTDGNVETVAQVKLTTSTGLTGLVHLDMVAATPTREWVIFGTGGTLVADVLGSTIRLTTPVGITSVLAEFAEGERDRAELNLIQHLVELAQPNIAPRCTSTDGIVALFVIEAARMSYSTGQAVRVLQDQRPYL